MLRTKKFTWLILACILVAFAAGCKKKPPPAPPPPPPPPGPTKVETPTAKPVVSSFSAEPSSIQRGRSSTLRWNVTGADSVSIDNGIGVVSASGTRSVSPSSSTTYTLTARNAGGSAMSTASVSVSDPPPPPPVPLAQPKASLDERLRNEITDVYFDYDKYDVREDARSVLSRNSDALKRILADFPNAAISVEGHCDERGSAEYNLGLGDRRSNSAKEFLTQLGVAGDRLRTISYGKEKPQCTEANEDCYQKNRRVHFSAGQ